MRVFEDITMAISVQELESVVVDGVFSGQQRAINRQKGNVNITNVVSADQIGKFPDSNIGDAIGGLINLVTKNPPAASLYCSVERTHPALSTELFRSVS